MKEPFQKDEAFLADVRITAGVADGALRLWWLGQSGFLLQRDGAHLLLDPYLSDSLTRKYAATDKPHVRVSARVVSPERLNFIDVMTSSHNHTDHLDTETITAVVNASRGFQAFVAPAANYSVVEERLGGCAAVVLAEDDGLRYPGPDGFEIEAVPAAHNTIERDEHGRCRYLGYVIRTKGCTVYHSGDTLWYDGMVGRLAAMKIDVALLPINGDRPDRRVAGNLNGREAARLAKEIGARVVIPCHYDMFEFNTADPYAEFVPECERAGQGYRVLRLGERWSSDELR